MKYNLILDENALEDLRTAYKYYEEIKKGLGEDFLNETQIFLNIISEKPLSFRKSNRYFRIAPLKRYPFILMYEVIKKSISIYAVFHTSRNPKMIRRKK